MTKATSQFLFVLLLTASFLPNSRGESNSTNDTKFIFPPSIAEKAEQGQDTVTGEVLTLDDGGVPLQLRLPKDWTAPASGEVVLTLHFHNPESFAGPEHARRGLNGPLIIANLGINTPAYQAPFKDKERFGRWIKMVEAKLKEKGAPEKTRITAVDISSYGAGYGAVREILGSPDYVKVIRRIIMCDSMYASYTTGPDGKKIRLPASEQIDPWANFAKAAASGEKTFVITYSQIQPDTYASTKECAAAIMSKVGGTISDVELDSCAAANDLTCALVSRGDIGNFHAWGYAGQDIAARMMHPWHLADFWNVLDQAGEP